MTTQAGTAKAVTQPSSATGTPQELTRTTKAGGTEAREQKTRETQAHTRRAGLLLSSSSNSLQLVLHARSCGRRPLYLGTGAWLVLLDQRGCPFRSDPLLMRWCFWTNEGARLGLARPINECITVCMELEKHVAHASYLPSQPWPSEWPCPLVLMTQYSSCTYTRCQACTPNGTLCTIQSHQTLAITMKLSAVATSPVDTTSKLSWNVIRRDAQTGNPHRIRNVDVLDHGKSCLCRT